MSYNVENLFLNRLIIFLSTLTIVIFFVDCSGPKQDELVVCSYGGSFQEAQRKAFFEPFEKETGIKIIEANWSGEYAKLKAMVESGNVTWDLVTVAENSIIERGIVDDILDTIDFSNINKEIFYDGALTKYSVGFDFFSTVMAYNSDAFSAENTPLSWKDFWNIEKFPGSRCLRKDPRTTLEFALLADGVNKDSLYPLDLDRAFRSLDKIKKHIKVWWTSGSQPAQLLVDKEVSIATAFNGRIWTAATKDKKPLKVVWSGGALDVDSWVIPKNSKNYQNAMKLIEYTCRPEVQKELTKYISYGPTIISAHDKLSPTVLNDLPTSSDNIKQQFLFNAKWWAMNEKEIEEKWNIWLIKD